MDFSVAIGLLIAESVFFSVLLVIFLKMASEKHRSHLKKLMELISKSEKKTKTISEEKKSIEEIRKQLFGQITGLQDEITSLKKTEQSYEQLKSSYSDLQTSYDQLKHEEANGTEDRLTKEAETTSAINTATVDELKQKLEYYKNRVFDLEHQIQELAPISDKGKYTIVSKPAINSKDTQKFLEESEELRKKIKTLTASTADQRTIIFNLEKEINQLRSEISKKQMSSEIKNQKQKEAVTLEKKLSETEGCISILENEIEVLHQKLTAIQQKNGETISIKNIDRNQSTLPESKTKKNFSMSHQIKNIISSTQNSSSDNVLEIIATEILDAIEPSGLDVFLVIKSTLGEVEVTASEKWSDNDKIALENSLSSNNFFSETDKKVLKIGGYHIGLLAMSANTDQSISIDDYKDALSTIILIGGSIIDSLEKRDKSSTKSHEFKQVVDAVRADAQKISIQQNYQTAEAQRIIDTFLVDLNNSLNTMNITEHQSAFFDEMIQEARGRMDLLLSTRSSVESDFTTMIGKLEKNGAALLH